MTYMTHPSLIFSPICMRTLALAVLLPLLLTACGHKGPLYLPQEDPAKNAQRQS
ncbi:LPS translocon maturation chaperone LptM [Nitrosomonas halophila]|uniref:LPS translocon maturation chaperone LptM n=1 Tax=Nitrosomonas halophila TaxID=44576 RepID=UPI003CCC18FA